MTFQPSLPLVSVIIPVFNGGDFLSQAIDSVLKQTYPNIEIIVVNDGSNDAGETDRIASSYGNRIIYLTKENGGVSSALNFGIQRMKGEFFSWLSHDDLYVATKIEEQVFYFFKEPKVELVYGNYDLWDGTPVLDCFCVTPNRDFPSIYPLFHLFRRQTNICTCLIRKELFERLGMFSLDSKTTQDYEFLFEAFRVANCHYINSTFVHTRIHERQGSKTISSHIDNAERMWIKFFNSLTKEELKELGGYKNFFIDSANYFNGTPYKAVSYFCRDKLAAQETQQEAFDFVIIYLPSEWVKARNSQDITYEERVKVQFFHNDEPSVFSKDFTSLQTYNFTASSLEDLIASLNFTFDKFTYAVFVDEGENIKFQELSIRLLEMRKALASCGVAVTKIKDHYSIFDIEWTDFIVRLDYLAKTRLLDSAFLALLEMEKYAKVIYFPERKSFAIGKEISQLLLGKYASMIFGSNVLSERVVLRNALLESLFLQKEKEQSNLFKKLIFSLRFEGYSSTFKRVLARLKRSLP